MTEKSLHCFLNVQSDAYLGAWNTIPPNNPDPLLAYVCRIVRNLSIAKYHKNTALKRNSIYDAALEELEEFLASNRDVEEEWDWHTSCSGSGLLLYGGKTERGRAERMEQGSSGSRCCILYPVCVYLHSIHCGFSGRLL